MRQPIPRPPRDLRLDVVRGWLQLSIFASHAFGSFIGGWMIHAAWGLSDSSEQFVLLSGLVLGSVFTLKAARDGAAVAGADMAWRSGRLWLTHLVVLALFGAMVFWAERVLPLPGEAARLGWSRLREAPLAAAIEALTMLWQPAFMGILPVFVLCMLALPGFLWLAGGPALLRHRGWIAAASAMLGLGLWLRMVEYGWLPSPVALDLTLILGKERLAVPGLLHALALAYLVAACVPREAGWMHHRAPRALAAVGKHSLRVFCIGLFLSYAAATCFRLLPDAPWWIDLLLIGAGAAVLIGYATLAERRRAAAPGPAAPASRRMTALARAR